MKIWQKSGFMRNVIISKLSNIFVLKFDTTVSKLVPVKECYRHRLFGQKEVLFVLKVMSKKINSVRGIALFESPYDCGKKLSTVSSQ